jgi:hypothetical protein
MPLEGAHYRMKGDVRLAFQGKKVVEAKNMKTGKVHTPEEFAAEREETTEPAHEVKDSDDYHEVMSRLKKRNAHGGR